VLGASGHIAGVINPASKNKRSHWIGQGEASTSTAWLDSATEHGGSWWGVWAEFLGKHGGEDVAAPAAPGSAQYPAGEAAPGSYVKARE
jgi:polyhydroxyalkanoate synthase